MGFKKRAIIALFSFLGGIKLSSYNSGKFEVQQWILNNVEEGSTCLDVGACDGIWYNLVGEHLQMDAVEVFEPNIRDNHLEEKYNRVFNMNIKDCAYLYYDCIIFGDIIEHLTVEDAQRVLKYAEEHSKHIIVAVPFLFKQGELYGNKYEIHIQDDLTKKLFDERYPGYEVLWENDQYAYYHKQNEIKFYFYKKI